jgi:hypothetical protein
MSPYLKIQNILMVIMVLIGCSCSSDEEMYVGHTFGPLRQ